MNNPPKKTEILNLAQQQGIITRQDLEQIEFKARPSGEYLSALEKAGDLVALAPGVYMDSDHEPGEFLEFAVVARKVPHSVIFGISALQFHGLTTHVAHGIQIAIERGKWQPRLHWPQVEIFSVSANAFNLGIEVHNIEESVELKVYSVARTIADLFKFRNTLGLEVAIDALKEGWHERRFSMEELYEQAKICRVHNVMRPYLEML